MNDHATTTAGESTSFGQPPVNRYQSAEAWRQVDEYFAQTLVGEDDALATARDSGVNSTMPNAEVAANQGALLGLITRMTGARRVLEFGTLAGYSTIWLARAVGSEGQVISLQLDHANAEIARVNLERANVADRVEVIEGSALESAQRLIDAGTQPFEVVFIDADKPNNSNYLRAALELTRPGAVIVIDNVVRDGAVVDANSEDDRVRGVRRVVEDIAANPELEATAIQTVGLKGWDGLIVARRVDSNAVPDAAKSSR